MVYFAAATTTAVDLDSVLKLRLMEGTRIRKSHAVILPGQGIIDDINILLTEFVRKGSVRYASS